ncbi:tumor necrosis factor a (TNF superfamily, member 2) [Salminus brasiliensis]|uniref:tumor necrosis factor a (TNF superfamily, member 2) n=1 Tax=Salminus brasiliensis TaxID=930266 RepID=UPI003B8318E4
MTSEKQVILEVDPAQVMFTREKASTAWSGRWKMCMALLAVAVCAAGAVFFTFNKTHNKPDETEDIRHTLRQVSYSAKAAIHLSGHYNSKISNTSVVWRDNEDQSFTDGGLVLKNNEIHIPHNGLYFVYSQASYRVTCNSKTVEDDEQVVHLSHMVSRWSDSYRSYQPLLSTVRTACKKTHSPSNEDHGEQWFSAVYVGAIFKLEAGDRLRTDMDAKMLPEVEAESGKTFFGVFSL